MLGSLSHKPISIFQTTGAVGNRTYRGLGANGRRCFLLLFEPSDTPNIPVRWVKRLLSNSYRRKNYATDIESRNYQNQ